MIIESKDIGMLRMLIGREYVDKFGPDYLTDILKDTTIFHYLVAAKILTNEPSPEIEEILKKIDKIIESTNKGE